jgi:hypothetical protein
VRPNHLGDERLFDCYLSECVGEALDPPAAEHLSDCPSCGTRYADLVSLMDDVRAEGDHETDSIFTVDRLRQQRQQIAARLEHVGQPAQVISFPSGTGRRRTTAATRVAPRWIAGAAAAGLFIGVAVGLFLDAGRSKVDFGRQRRHPSVATAEGLVGARVGASPPAVSLAPAAPSEAVFASDESSRVAQALDEDDVFLSELELALAHPRTHELQPFDVLTPRVREVSTELR